MTPLTLKETTILLLLYCFITNARSKPALLKNVDCSPHPDYIETDILNYYRYTPSIITLHRCHGANSVNDLQFKKCIPSEDGVTDVDISVMNNNYQTPLTITVKNHTSCVQKCIIDKSVCSLYQNFLPDDCICKCNYDKPPEPYPCADPYRWETSMCNCVCSVESKECDDEKEFNNRTCKCECKLVSYVKCARRKKVVDEKTCHCIDPV